MTTQSLAEAAIERGMIPARRLEAARLKMEEGFADVLAIGGVAGLEACIAGTLLRVVEAHYRRGGG